MALRRFSDNPLASTLTGTEIVPGIQGGVDVQITAQDIADLGGGGSGDVVGPSTSVDNRLATFDGTTGKLIQDSGVLLSDLALSRNVVTTVTSSGGITTLWWPRVFSSGMRAMKASSSALQPVRASISCGAPVASTWPSSMATSQ